MNEHAPVFLNLFFYWRTLPRFNRLQKGLLPKRKVFSSRMFNILRFEF